MTESQFSELRGYAEVPDQCIDHGYRPGNALISNGWLREIVPGCWQITTEGADAFKAVVEGRSALRADRR